MSNLNANIAVFKNLDFLKIYTCFFLNKGDITCTTYNLN
jgi:hypothetical protein